VNAHGWLLRPLIWYPTAYITVTTLHELTHALAAYRFGIGGTLRSLSVDLQRSHGTLRQRAIIGVAGPAAALVIGIAAWLAYRRLRATAAALPLLYVAVFGVGTFFGNLMSAAFVGDFSNAAVILDLPMWARYAAAATGLAILVLWQFGVGREFRQWIPVSVGAVRGAAGIILLPVVVGTAVIVLLNMRVSGALVGARIGEAAFWVFSAVGVLLGGSRRPLGAGTPVRVVALDLVLAVIAVLVTWLLASGVSFNAGT
jgi:hypothetical protein